MIKAIYRTKKKGSATVEAILAISLFALIITGVIGAFLYSVQSNYAASVVNQASFLVDQGFSATKSIKDTSFASLVNGTYGLSSGGSSWSFSGSSDTSGIFTRTVSISTVDVLTKQITVTVSWPPQFTGVSNISQSMYLTNWDRFVAVLGNWAIPSTQSSVNVAGSVTIVGLRYVGNYAFAITSSGSNNFIVFDVTNLASPVQVTTLSLPGTLNYISIAGNFAYVTSSSNSQELSIVDISNPLSPVSTPLNLSGNDDARNSYIDQSNNRLYVIRSNSSNPELSVFSTSAAPSLVSLGDYNTTDTLNEISVQGNYAFVASTNNSREIQILNVTNPASISLSGTLNLSGTTDGVRSRAFGGNRLIITRSDGSTLLYNSTNPLSISLISTYSAGGAVNDLSLGNSNQYIFMATSNSAREFQVVNITTEASPVLLGSLNLSGNLNGLEYDAADDRVYTGGSSANPEFLILRPN